MATIRYSIGKRPTKTADSLLSLIGPIEYLICRHSIKIPRIVIGSIVVSL